jgi:hypothetical protein
MRGETYGSDEYTNHLSSILRGLKPRSRLVICDDVRGRGGDQDEFMGARNGSVFQAAGRTRSEFGDVVMMCLGLQISSPSLRVLGSENDCMVRCIDGYS